VPETRADPTVGFPPLPGSADTAPAPLTDEEKNDPLLQNFFAGKVNPASGALGTIDADFPGGKRPTPGAPPAPAPAGDLGLPPPGVVEMYKPGDVFSAMNRYSAAAAVMPEAAHLAEPWTKLWDDRTNGIGLYSDGNRYFMPGGPKDPAVIRQQTGAAAGGTAAGAAPYGRIEKIPVTRPDGTVEVRNYQQGADGSWGEVQVGGGAPGPARGAGAPGAAPGAPGAGPTPAATPIGGFQVEPSIGVVNQLREANENAGRQLTTLGEINHLMGTIETGPFADRKADLGAKLKALGIDGGTVDRVLGPAENAEALRKAFWQLGTTQVTGALGGHPAGYVVEQGLTANPNIALLPGANELMTNLMGMQARRTQDQYSAASDAMSKTPAGGYGAGGVFGAVNDAVRGVSGRYDPEAMLGAARMMTKAPNLGGWSPDMYDPQTGAPTPKGELALGLIPPGTRFYSAAGKPLRKDASGKVSPVQ
jgi:hypothetical protein